MKLNARQHDKLMIKWRYWDKALRRLWDKNITQGRRYGQVFFKVQALDCAIRFMDTGQYEDPQWPKMNKTLPVSHRPKAEKHQLELVRSAKMLVNNL